MQLLSLYRPLAFLTFFLSAAFAATAGNPPVALPYEGDFEAAEGFSAGPLLSHSEWNFEAGLDAEILPFGAYGDQTLGFSGEHWLWLDTLGLPAGEITWVDFYLLPVFAGADQLPQEIQTAQSAVTGFVQLDTEGEVYAIDGDGKGSGQWLASGQRTALSGNSSQDWLRLTYRLDYANKQWDLFVDGRMALTDLGFLDDTVLQLTEFAFFGDASQTSVLDYFYLGGTNPLYPDSSNDGLPDAWLTAQGLDVLVNQRGDDPDADGLDNLAEYRKGTRADLADTDGDGIADGREIALELDPNHADSDDDGVMDGTELALGLDPRHPDSDRDGFSDGAELSLGTDPLLFDTDADGLADSLEPVWNLDPLTADPWLATLGETAVGTGIFHWTQHFSASEGFIEGPLDGQQGWQAQGSATVAGGQIEMAAFATEDASFSRLAGVGETRQIWVGFRARLVAGPLPDLSARAEPAVAAWGAAAPHTIAIWDEAVGHWVEYAAPADLTEWNDYRLFFDYEARQWHLSQNGVLIAGELDFFDDDLVVFSRFKALQVQVSEASSPDAPQSSAFSDFVISTTEPTAPTEALVANTQQIPQEEIQNGDFSGLQIGEGDRPDVEDVTNPRWDFWDESNVTEWEAINGNNIELQTLFPKKAGDPYAELVAHPDGHSGLRQTVGTRVGQTYLLRFDCAAHPWYDLAQSTFTVKAYGLNSDEVKNDGPEFSLSVQFNEKNKWETRILVFTASSERTNIDFIPSGISGCIDNVKLLKMDLVLMWETKNKANQIYNPTFKDDPWGDGGSGYGGEENGAPRNMLFLVPDPADDKYKVTLEMEIPEILRTEFYAAAYVENTKIENSDTSFDSEGVCELEFEHLGTSEEIEEFEIRVGYDANDSGSLDPSEVIKLDVENLGEPIVMGTKESRYTSASSSIDSIISGTLVGIGTDLILPHAKRFLQIFQDGDASGLPSDKQPTSSTQVTFDAYNGYFSEWLTHNSGALFSDEGVATITDYTWDTNTTTADLVATSPQIEDAVQDYFDQSVNPLVLSHFENLPVGATAYFPSSSGFYDVPHTHESPDSVPTTTITFNSWLPNIGDDVNGTIGRGRLLNHKVRYRVEKEQTTIYPPYPGLPYNQIRLKVTEVLSVGEVIDLYDFNFMTGGAGQNAAILQIGFGNGSYGANRNQGIIYRNRIEFEKTYNALP